LNSPVYDAIHQAFKNGALIAGTSAGAAVMSKKMITGNEIKHPEYTGNFRTIESNNIEIKEGLGLNRSIIVDQHFVKRMRMNRLIATCLENPMETCIGIDESTAILIEGDKATVYGESQVIVLKHTTAETKIMDGLLGGEKMELNVYLPGDSFKIENL
ncbi:MAG: Type 1 glutamine amidotransferase-like domain-containing protein, partial [Bacteroidales bacterium]|nr:Type 1 glutamine amidotransferase-like domain-containing protein [Bacteroidales bacterium]